MELLGEGGMGEVYLAEQREPVQRRVALKVIKLGMGSREVLARFELERQALAVMSHESIARVFDAGVTAPGQPYFVMEYVEGGVPLTRFCAEHELSVQDRVELVVQVCEGVQHAHQRGVLHRDLKPGNILATMSHGRPRVKIIDFGLARTMGEDDGRREPTLLTRQGQLLGTPEYMAPEQARGDAAAIDTRTDVYAIGVILYEL
ncbi:MAG: serine/threonine-protein kinase, partial [Planctomycetota bacterium]